MELPELAPPETLHTLDVAGLQAQLGLAQQATEIISQIRQDLFESLVTDQKTLSDIQNKIYKTKTDLKKSAIEANMYNERIKILKTLLKGEKA